jgi:nitrous oxidase accessory protein NosD
MLGGLFSRRVTRRDVARVLASFVVVRSRREQPTSPRNLGEQADFVSDGIHYVPDSATRDLVFATPETNQRVQNRQTGYVERFDGENWVADIRLQAGSGVFDPLAYGAKGDGVTDDSAAIQAAINAAAAAGGGVVHVTKLCKVTIQGSRPGINYCITVPSNVVILGDGYGTGLTCGQDGATIIHARGSADDTPVVRVKIRNLKIVGADSTNNFIGRGIFLDRASYCEVVGCDVSGTIIGIQSDRPSTDVNRNTGNYICDNVIHDTFGSVTGCGTGIFAALSTGLRICRNRCYNIAEHCVYVERAIHDLLIAENDLHPFGSGNQNGCVHIFTSAVTPDRDGIIVANNTCVGGKWGVIASNTSGVSTNLIVSGNKISDQNGGQGVILSNIHSSLVSGNTVTGVTSGDGIRADHGRNIHFTGNIVSKCGYSGLMFFATSDSSIVGNTSINNDQSNTTNYGLRIADVSTGNRIIGNIATDYQRRKTQHYGIQVDLGATGNFIDGNFVSGNAAGPVSIASLGNDLRNNAGYNPVGPSSISVGASPFTYTAANTPETVHVFDGVVSSITKNGVQLARVTNVSVNLDSGQSVVVRYSVAPFMTKDVH